MNARDLEQSKITEEQYVDALLAGKDAYYANLNRGEKFNELDIYQRVSLPLNSPERPRAEWVVVVDALIALGWGPKEDAA